MAQQPESKAMATFVVDRGARVNVIIPNRNGMQHLEECFASLDAQTFRDFIVTFVDNASSDGSVAWVRKHSPQTRVIAREADGGFSASVNDGIRSARCEYVSILNNDVRLEPEWLEALVRELDSRPDYDFATPLLIMYYEPGLVNAAGDVFDLAVLGATNRGAGRPTSDYRDKVRVLGATANGVVYRTEFFDEVGLYDEEFYLQHEDSDINLRALIAGKKCVFVPESRVFHKIRSCAGQYQSDALARLNSRNEGIVAGKGVPVSLLAGYFLDPRRFRVSLFRLFSLWPWSWRFIPGRFREGLERSAAWVEGFRMGWDKRDEVWSRRKISMREIRWWIRHGESDL